MLKKHAIYDVQKSIIVFRQLEEISTNPPFSQLILKHLEHFFGFKYRIKHKPFFIIFDGPKMRGEIYYCNT